VGSYVAARLSGTSDNTDGTLHGLAVWATSFLISAVLLGNLVAGVASTAANSASSLLGGVARGAGSAVSAASNAAGAALPNAAQGVVDRVQGALSGSGGAPASMTSDQRKAEMGTLATRRVTDGQLSAADRERLNALVAAEYNIPAQERSSGFRRPSSRRSRRRGGRRRQHVRRQMRQHRAPLRQAMPSSGSCCSAPLPRLAGARRGVRDVLVRGSRVAR
jgi:hypothetical protein